MSYILDALRKAEHERHLGQPPSPISRPLPQPARRRFWLWLVLGLGLGTNLGLLAFFLTRSRPSAPPAFTASTALEAPAPIVAAGPSAPTPSSAVQSLPPPSTAAKSAAPPAGRERREMPARPPTIPGSVTLVSVPEPVPTLETLSAGARRGIPELNLDIHVHSADPDKRFVVINGRRYREGDRLGEGPTLETVTRDGAILRQGNQRFRLLVRR